MTDADTAASAGAPVTRQPLLAHVEPWSLLAGLRFVLAAIVAINHLGEYVDLGALAWVRRMGAFEAILGFLLISGYSIGASYLQRPDGFLRRRVRRIYPVYLVSVVLTWLVTVVWMKKPAPAFGELLANLLLLNQALTRSSFVGPAWSLALEFWLYLLTPLLVAAGPRRLRAWVGLSFVAYLGYTALRSLLHWPYFSGVGFGANLLLLSFAWVCGLRLALARQPAGVALVDTRLIFALHLASAAAIQFAWRLKHQALERFVAEDLSALFLQAGALLVVYTVFARGVLVAQQPGALRSRALQWLGDVSYPLFLLHIPIYTLLSQTALRTPWAYLGVATLASAMVLALLEAVSRPRSAGPPSRTSAGIPSS